MIQKHAIPLVGNIKRNILVGDLAGRSAILIPHFHHLAVLHKRGVPLTKSIDALVHIDGQLLHHIGFSRIPVGHMGHVAESGVGQFPVSVEETDSPAVRPLIDNRRCAAALIADFLLCFLDCHMGGGLLNPGEGAAVSGSLKMPHGNLNHIFHWTGETDGEHPQIQAVSSSRDMLSRRIDYEFIPMYPAVCEFCRVKRSDFPFGTPVTFCEFHKMHMETRVFRHERNCAPPDFFASSFSFLFFCFSNICLLLTPNYGKIYLVHKSIMRYKIYEIYYHYC